MDHDELMFRPGLLAGQRVLVTGGGTGLGRVIAEACLLLGSEVYICGRRSDVLQRTASELQSAHAGRVVPLQCDLRQHEAIVELIDHVWSDGGPLTGLVNNAAGNFLSRTEDLSPRGFDAIANTVFRGSFLVTLECAKRWLAEGRRASVVSMLTTWVWNGSPFTVPSAMSKAALRAMTQSLAVEWGPRGLRLNAIAPGLFPTPGMSARLDPGGSSYDPASRNPMRRAGRMTELANLAVFLLSDGAGYVNGETIAIDGAEHLATGGNFAHLASWTPQQWLEAREAARRTDAADKQARRS